MADEPTQSPMTETSGLPLDLFRQMMTHQGGQGDIGGLTSVQPNLSPVAPIQNPQRPEQRIQPAQAVGVGQGGAVRRQGMQNTVAAAQNLANQLGQQVQAKKRREDMQVTGQFTSMVRGINDAKSQLQQGQQLVQQGQQSNNPQMVQQGQQMMQAAQQSLQQNMTNYNDLVNDPKKHKIIIKAFGIDDKNANSPERQAAIQSLKQQNQGMSDQGASMMSRLPQTQQLSPEGQARAGLVQAGVVGRPATGGQVLNAESRALSDQMKWAINTANNAVKQGIAADKLAPVLERSGLTMEKDSSGQPQRNPDGTLVIRQMTPEERKKNPVLSAQDELTKAKTDAQRADADAKMNPQNPLLQLKARQLGISALDAQARMISAQASAARAAIAMSPVAAAAGKKADDLETTYKNAQDYLKNPSPTNDTQLIFAYVRSAVAGAGRMTNTEIEAALKSGSFGTRASNAYNRALSGKLDDDFRQQLVNSIGIAATNARGTASKYMQGEPAGAPVGDADIVVDPKDVK